MKLKIQSTVSNMLGWIIACHDNILLCLDNFRTIACSSIPTNIQIQISMQRVCNGMNANRMINAENYISY